MATQADVNVPVTPLPLTGERQEWLERAWANIDPDRLANLDLALTRIPSPTGEERAIAEFLTAELRSAGLDGRYQPIDEGQGNAVGRLRGSGEGPDLLLFAPLDTAFAGTDEEDVPWIGPSVRADLRAQPFLEDGNVVGLGAENPKGYVSCVVHAAEVVRQAGIPLRGDVVVGLAAGGMPTNKRPALGRWNAGQGNGASFMLEQGVRGDFAIIAKPGWAVAWEEVGLSWFRVTVKGGLNYTGIRHVVPYTNPIVEATKVIAGLEEWFPEYTARNTSGLVAPQGSIGAIEGGWTYKPAFVPWACHLYVDLRLSPRTSPMDAKHQFGEAIARIRERNPGLDLDWEMILSIPGGHTNPHNWIIQSLMRAWEQLEGRPHEPARNTSGATDAAILRGRGIPTARLGLPRARGLPGYPGFSMGVANIDSMQRLTRALVYGIIDTCTRDRAEVGL
jgi:acetylornithine deacetylase/succinyl-diaminopimelate desuccinylase-like protein